MITTKIALPTIVSREEWLAARIVQSHKFKLFNKTKGK